MDFDLFVGLIFSLIFLVSFENDFLGIKVVSIIAFIISFIYLIKFLAGKFNNSRFLSYGLIVFLSLNVFLFWVFILNPIKNILFFILLFIFLLTFIFYLIHVYLFVLFKNNIGDLKIINFILIFVVVFLLSCYLYQHIIFYILLIISEIIFIKANFDLVERYFIK